MRQRIRKSRGPVTAGLVMRNWKAFIMFELLYKLLITVAGFPLLGLCFAGIMRLSGYPYLTRENIWLFLKHPLTILMILAFVLLAATVNMIDISAVIYTLDQSRQKEQAGLVAIIRFSVRNALRIWLPQNYLLVLVLLMLMPFASIGMATGVMSTLSLPGFVTEVILSKKLYTILAAALVMIAGLLLMRWLYAIHYYTLEGCSFRQAHQRSAALSDKHRLGDFLTLIASQTVFWLVQLGLTVGLVSAAMALSGFFENMFVLRWLTTTGVWIVVVLVILASMALSTPVAYAVVSALFYLHKEEKGEEEIHIPPPGMEKDPARLRLQHRILLSAAGLLLVAAFGVGFLFTSGRLNPQIEHVRVMEITAHRGASAFYPENTMAAFRGAWEQGADWTELDVQQTKDGQIIVMHDSNTKRTTGKNANVWELTYDEIAQLDAGSFFSPEFAGEKVPLLREVAAFSKESGLRLNVELKPTGHEKDFEKAVVDIIREYGLENDCVITSQVYGVLERVKEYDPEMETVYVMSLAYGDITRMEAADHFSVEASSATSRMVSHVHNAGKQIYAWTVNSEKSINSMIENRVDNIITDNIPLARKCVEDSRYSDLLSDFIKLLGQQRPELTLPELRWK